MKKLLILSFLFFTIVNCNENDDAPSDIDCSQVVCTEEFITIVITIKDDSAVAVPLDRFEVLDENTNEDISIPLSDSGFQNARETGQYPLYNDSFVSENQNTNRSIIFRGFIDSNEVVEALYVISTDCCHVSLASGNTEITIN